MRYLYRLQVWGLAPTSEVCEDFQMIGDALRRAAQYLDDPTDERRVTIHGPGGEQILRF